MKRLALTSAFATTLALTGAFAQSAAAQQAGPVPTIEAGHTLLTVNAEGSTSRKPDLAVFSAGVASSGKTAGEALSANSADMSRVIQALKRSGIADRDIQTSNLSLNPVYADTSRQPADPLAQQAPRIIGYQASNTVTVKQRNLGAFGKVIDTLVSTGANQVSGPSFQVDQPDPALDEARVDAVKKARERANLYARAIGMKVLRIVSIGESGGYSPPRPMYRMAMADSAGAPPVAAGEVSLEMNVTVQFELAP
jgi:uncharacterized protein YggE